MPSFHLEEPKKEASMKALMRDGRLKEVQRPRQGREKQRMSPRWGWGESSGVWCGEGGGGDMGRLTSGLQGIARRLLIRTQANEGHSIRAKRTLRCQSSRLLSENDAFFFFA